jgi:transmembrane sensor
MLRKEDIAKIERYVNQQVEEKDKNYVESLFSDGENNAELKQLLEKDWETIPEIHEMKSTNLIQLLDKIHHIIHLNEQQTKPPHPKRYINIYAKVAAVLFIPILITSGLIYSHRVRKIESIIHEKATSEIYAPLGSRVSFTLPDGTVGMLNSGSSLSYTLPFTNNRKVDLKGEAWFEVYHDAKNPFEISTGKSTVKVLGTSFNISAYPEENYVEVVLKEGKVEFKDNLSNDTFEIHQSERLIFKDGRVTKENTDPEKYNCWTSGMLVFKGDPMLEVVRRIERWYNVQIVLADSELENYSFRATFLDDSVEDVMKFLSMTTPIKYKIIPRQLLPDNTYTKEVITIYMLKSYN